MNRYRFVVTFEGYVWGTDPADASDQAEEEVTAGAWPITSTEVVRDKPREEANGTGNS